MAKGEISNGKCVGNKNAWDNDIKKEFEKLLKLEQAEIKKSKEDEINKKYCMGLYNFFSCEIYNDQVNLEDKIEKIKKIKNNMEEDLKKLYDGIELDGKPILIEKKNELQGKIKNEIKKMIGEPWRAKEEFLKKNIRKRTQNLKNQPDIFKDFCSVIDKQLDEIQKFPYT